MSHPCQYGNAKDFLMYGFPDHLKHFTEQHISDIINMAHNNPEIIKDDLMDVLFENGLCLGYDAAKIYVKKIWIAN